MDGEAASAHRLAVDEVVAHEQIPVKRSVSQAWHFADLSGVTRVVGAVRSSGSGERGSRGAWIQEILVRSSSIGCVKLQTLAQASQQLRFTDGERSGSSVPGIQIVQLSKRPE